MAHNLWAYLLTGVWVRSWSTNCPHCIIISEYRTCGALTSLWILTDTNLGLGKGEPKVKKLNLIVDILISKADLIGQQNCRHTYLGHCDFLGTSNHRHRRVLITCKCGKYLTYDKYMYKSVNQNTYRVNARIDLPYSGKFRLLHHPVRVRYLVVWSHGKVCSSQRKTLGISITSERGHPCIT